MRLWMLRRVLFSLLVAVLATGCGDDGGDSSGTDTSSSGDSSSGSDMAVEKSWSEKDRGERIQFMTTTLHPTMATVFLDKDAVKFQGFTCTNCHGADYFSPAVDYVMPNPANAGSTEIGDGMPGVINYGETDPEYVEYRDTYMPGIALQVAQILELELESTDNPSGFGCNSCHPLQ